ncbi:hypothetical protein ABK040_001269 [Willaertia magna]
MGNELEKPSRQLTSSSSTLSTRKKKQQQKVQVVSFTATNDEDDFVVIDPVVNNSSSLVNKQQRSSSFTFYPSRKIGTTTTSNVTTTNNNNFNNGESSKSFLSTFSGSITTHNNSLINNLNNLPELIEVNEDDDEDYNKAIFSSFSSGTQLRDYLFSLNKKKCLLCNCEGEILIKIFKYLLFYNNLNNFNENNNILKMVYNLNLICQYWNIMVWDHSVYSDKIWKFIFKQIISKNHIFYTFVNFKSLNSSNLNNGGLNLLNLQNLNLQNYSFIENAIGKTKILKLLNTINQRYSTYKKKCKLYCKYNWKTITDCCKPIVNNNLTDSFLEACLIKTVLIGSQKVGKTCLSTRFFRPSYFSNGFCTNINNTCCSTVSFDFNSEYLKVNYNRYNLKNNLNQNYTIRLQVWDSGDLRNESEEICSSVLKDVDVCLFCFAMDDLNSFLDLQNIHLPLIKDIIYYKNNQSFEEIPKLLIGLKSDLYNDKIIKKNDILSFALNNDMPFIEVSSKRDDNCLLPFYFSAFCVESNGYLAYHEKEDEIDNAILSLLLNCSKLK